jgi:hypothetical protein
VLHASGVIASRKHSAEDMKRNGGEPAADELDYALLRLAEPVGQQPLGDKGPSDVTGTARGYIRLSASTSPLKEDDPVIVLQHPQPPGLAKQQPIQLSTALRWPRPFQSGGSGTTRGRTRVLPARRCSVPT